VLATRIRIARESGWNVKAFQLATELGRLTPAEVDRAEAIAQSVLPAIINATKRSDRGGTVALADPEAIADRAYGYALAIIRESRAYREGKAGAGEAAPAPFAARAAR
jgi:hypothetical protein